MFCRSNTDNNRPSSKQSQLRVRCSLTSADSGLSDFVRLLLKPLSFTLLPSCSCGFASSASASASGSAMNQNKSNVENSNAFEAEVGHGNARLQKPFQLVTHMCRSYLWKVDADIKCVSGSDLAANNTKQQKAQHVFHQLLTLLLPPLLSTPLAICHWLLGLGFASLSSCSLLCCFFLGYEEKQVASKSQE
jgi:hypothetical protein